MNERLRVAVIVSRDKSDLYFANQLLNNLNVVGVIVENQVASGDRSSLPRKALKYLTSPRVFLNKLLTRASDSYRKRYADYRKPENAVDFGPEGLSLFPPDTTPVVYTKGVKAINDAEYTEWLRDLQPDVIAVCGASILRAPVLSIPKHGVLNLHGGLAQRYRGLFTTDWAVHNDEPEYVGASVHFVSEGIDDGDIIYQGRPAIDANDQPHSLYVKLVKLGVKMMIQAVQDLEQGTCRSVVLTEKGKLYLESAYDDGAKTRAWSLVRSGSMQRYMANKEQRDRPVKALMVNVHSDSA